MHCTLNLSRLFGTHPPSDRWVAGDYLAIVTATGSKWPHLHTEAEDPRTLFALAVGVSAVAHAAFAMSSTAAMWKLDIVEPLLKRSTLTFQMGQRLGLPFFMQITYLILGFLLLNPLSIFSTPMQRFLSKKETILNVILLDARSLSQVTWMILR